MNPVLKHALTHVWSSHAAPSDAAALPAPRAAALRASACPGLLRIVDACDGGLCRIKLPGGVLHAEQARAIGHAAAQHAAGVIEVTNRANLQLRGVRAGHEAALIDTLLQAGLGPHGATPERAAAFAGSGCAVSSRAGSADDVRNVLVSPTAGRDPDALIDTTGLTAQLLTLLQTEPRFAALSPKFALLLDGGERLARLDHAHDIWLAAVASDDHADSDDKNVRFAFGLAGCPPVDDASDASVANPGGSATAPHEDEAPLSTAPQRRRMSAALACVAPSQVPALVNALLHTFLDLAADDAARMRDLLAAVPLDTVLQHAQTYTGFPLTRAASLASWRRAPSEASLRLGVHPQRRDGMHYVGAQAPLGRLDAAVLLRVAALAQTHGNGTLRMTPWQSVLLPDIAGAATSAVVAELEALGLACDPADVVAHLIACAGSTGCAKSQADTKADALQLAAHLAAHLTKPAAWQHEVHLSGCPRSCAAAHRAPYTLLAAAPGLYDLYRRDATPGFGACVAHRLTIKQAADALVRLARRPVDA